MENSMKVHPPLYVTVKQWVRYHLYKSNGWNFSKGRKIQYTNEYDEWLRFYLPIDVNGLTVLDEGAGEGETARFFLEQGAKKIICVEPDAKAFGNLLANAKNRSMECFNRRFKLSDLDMDFDFMKMDIEGYEEELLNAPAFKKPCVIEFHGLQLREKFVRYGYIIRDKTDWLSSEGYAYKNINTNMTKKAR